MLCDECISPVHCNQLSESERDTETPSPSTVQLAQRRLFLLRKINELSPTARIPLDILIEIFQIACKPVYDGYYKSRQAVTPFFIGSICRLWRDVVWSTPLLWSTIFLQISRKHHDTQIQLLGDWLLNARSAPLSIKLTLQDEHVSVLYAFEAIVRILVTKSDQWATFDSCLPPPQCSNIFKNINFPMLTSVLLRSPSSTSNIPEMFLTAPKLVDISLRGYNFSVVLPWEQIRHFRTGRSSVNGCLKILQQSPNLQECHFGGVYLQHGFFSEAIEPHAHTQLTQLKHLHVKLDSLWSTSLFDSITLPSLFNFHIQYSCSQSLPLSSVTSLFLRSACNLERLIIRSHFDDKDLILCLEAIPSLSYLHLDMVVDPRADIGLTRHLVASLDPLSNSSRLLLPNLEYFKYRGRVLCDCRTVLDMLARRWHLPSYDDGTSQSTFVTKVSKLKLAEVVSIDRYHVTADVHEELRKLSEEGMSVKIKPLTSILMELVDL